MTTSSVSSGPEAPAGEGAQVTPRAGVARAVVRTGFLLSFSLVLGSAVEGAFGERGWPLDLYWTLAFAAAAVALLLILPPLADRGLLGGGTRTEIGRGNVAAALAAAANRLAVGIVLSHCLYGADLPTFLVSLAFVALGFASLFFMQWLYRLLTHYSDADEVADQNVAAALSYAGVTVAFAIIVGNAADGVFTGWASSLARYAGAMLLGLGLYPVRQVVVHRLLLGLPFALRGGALDRAIDQERNSVIGAVEGAAYVATALLVTGIFP